ncbi:hypothetical protein [Paenibacillus aquistagni]|uniref:Uncharacterized protein n=1 Tax=Paenibacillus aquistagni TaxID=1852522 RepID=A0A1X7LYU4_9BACL|nr:hypothetical protein [Paenibacillus aquistagni]SMG58269.1 hypothetical protein SAMN06295960_4654 [Paenibacillus aquistagni]
MSLLNNVWFVGIIGGIISGVIVYFITDFFVSKKNKKIYKEKINLANAEVLNSLKPMVTDETSFDIKLYQTVSRAIATKHKINQIDLYDFKIVIDLITTEIMQSQFLSYEQKKNYANTLINVYREQEKIDIQNDKEIQTVVSISNTNTVSSKYLSLTLAIMTTLFAIISTTYISLDRLNELNKIANINDQVRAVLVLLTAIPLLSVLALTLMQSTLALKKIKRNKLIETTSSIGTENKEEN